MFNRKAMSNDFCVTYTECDDFQIAVLMHQVEYKKQKKTEYQ
jgi:hypothetical protein